MAGLGARLRSSPLGNVREYGMVLLPTSIAVVGALIFLLTQLTSGAR